MIADRLCLRHKADPGARQTAIAALGYLKKLINVSELI